MTIDPAEEQALRLSFEEMLTKSPWDYSSGHFRRTTEAGYYYPNVQLAWHTLKCGYLAGLTYKGTK